MTRQESESAIEAPTRISEIAGSQLEQIPDSQTNAAPHTFDSSTREKVLEHLFLGELLRCLWTQGRRDIEVLRGEVDKGGYDVVVDCGGIMRHIQLKSSHRDATTSTQKVNINLARRPSGCIIWVYFDEITLELGPFRWFGAAPGQPLPPLGDRIGKHTKGDRTGLKAERPNIRILNRGDFCLIATMPLLVGQLFGSS